MRKTKNNDRQDLIRMHKTPSPSSFADIKSPRFGRNINKAQQINAKTSTHKEQQKLDMFKAYLLQLKQRQNVGIDENIDSKQKRGIRQQHLRSPTTPIIDSNPYSLGAQTNSQVQSKVQEKRPRNLESDRECSRKTSVSRDGSESGQGRNSYQETIRKLANQNIKLRHQCKVMQEKFEKNLQQRKNISTQNESLKMEVEKMLKQNEQLIKKEINLGEEIKNLKKMLTINSEQLSQSNYEIYKMKQQIFQLRLTIQKLETKKREKSASSHQKGFNSEKLLQSSTKIDVCPPSCKTCKILAANISQLTTRFQNAKLQVGERTNTISSLRSEIGRLEGELKLLQKPRILYKKYNSIISELNQEIVNEKAKQLSYKYLKLR